MSEDAGYDPELKRVVTKVRRALEGEDVGYALMLISPTHSEYLMHLTPSWSALTLDGHTLRIRVDQAEMGRERAQQVAEGTVHLVAHLGQLGGHFVRASHEIMEALQQRWQIEFTEPRHRPGRPDDPHGA